jgi:1-acyl-sn-glycerol-3-phosphate acyltransferase
MLYHIGRWAVRTFFFLFTRFEVRGREHVPRNGGVLVAANHLNLADPPVVGVSLGRATFFMAKEELFRSAFSGYFVSRFGAFPVHRGQLDREALRQAESILSRSKALVMFPEGARKGSESHLAEGYLGAALIAGRAGVPVLPVGITGTEAMVGWKWVLRRPRITVRVGKPFRLPSAAGKKRRAELTANTSLIMASIAALLPPEYRNSHDGTHRIESEPDNVVHG